ncbi:unnamed protein product [Arabis nemorensis]|uniref:Uncharacterized protein n=1 Tax=Arabis nemorensis TaxID=586526 RepID=A0A565CDH8_9BRAS|nr:unnamed protein product [Arabis nemorensis]
MESPMSVALGDWVISRMCLLHLCLVSFVLDMRLGCSHLRSARRVGSLGLDWVLAAGSSLVYV